MAATKRGSTGLEEFSYDPWGRRRDAHNWNNYEVTEPTLFTRGFTGHEHIGGYGLINMNGRVYDPRLGRFLSPDPYVQAPDFSQSFNRYSYVWNNPLKYTDPDGEIVFTIIGALLAPFTGGASLAIGIAMDVGGAINLGTKFLQGRITSWGDGFAAYGIGAAAGAIGYATGGAAFAMAGGAAGGAGGLLAGFTGGAMGSAFAMPVQSIGNAMYFVYPMISGKQYLLGVAFGGLMGGTINGTIAAFNNRSFLTGIKNYELTSPGRFAFDPNAGRQGTRVNTEGMRSELKSLPSSRGEIREFNAMELLSKELNRPKIYSTDHVKHGIFDALSPNRIEGFDKVAKIVIDVDRAGLLVRGHNQIRFTANGSLMEIRLFINSEGVVKSLDAFVLYGNSRNINNVVIW